YQFELVPFRGTLDLNAVFGPVSSVAGAITAAGKPGSVIDLAVSGASDTSVTLSFTEARDGTGQPASYDIRYAAGTISWGGATEVTRGSCAAAVAGSTIGAKRTCTVLGLAPAAGYQFQLVPFRGTLNLNAVFGGLSNVATGTTTPPTLVPVASVTTNPASVSQLVGTTQQLTATLKDTSGNVLTGRAVTWTSSNSTVATVNSTGFETSVGPGTATITATSGGVSGTSAITVNATAPSTVSDLAIAAKVDTSVTLSFTEVNDGTGQPASYEMRYGAGTIYWGPAAIVTRGTCASPTFGTVIGAKRACTVLGLSPLTAYTFQLVAFRGKLNLSAVFGGLSNVASGTTAAASTAPVASVTVSPATGSITVGGTQQFAATVKDGNGNVLTSQLVSWSNLNPDVATVSGGGLVKALVVGTALITATSGGQSGTAMLAVTALPPPPSGSWPNEPAGFRVLTDWGLDQVLPTSGDVPIVGSLGWNVVYNASPGSARGWAQLVSDPSAPFSPASVYDFVYPQGMVEGTAPATVYYPTLSSNEVYVGFWWKPSSPFDLGPNGNKIAFLFNGGGTGGGQMFMILKGDLRLHVLSEYPGDFRWRDPNINSTAVTLGAWHRIEWYGQLSTGTMKWWLDGVLQGSYSDVHTTSAFNMFQFSPTWGGNSGARKAETQAVERSPEPRRPFELHQNAAPCSLPNPQLAKFPQ
ncbi:MAG: hypothetical protein E6K74_12805, partial [Candidatus Eisenbacteria bacterium]